MKNPYIVLGINQDASMQDVNSAVATAMRNKKFPSQEIAKARAILSRPDSRLATDMTFPIFTYNKTFKEIKASVKSEGIDIKSINQDKYNSL